MKENVVMDKSFKFALNVIKASSFLIHEKREFILSKQLVRSGTSIGALIKEAEHAQSKADFINKMNIALKEANETEYWLMLIKESDYGSEVNYKSLLEECKELIRMLVSIVKTSKDLYGPKK
ncbi:MAG: four helix bundle protein [Prolixibacteraceae bacterium]|jgi:four helix bundle protein|nr:four helix bundle protein [Prolixibacteraceae bacterium]